MGWLVSQSVSQSVNQSVESLKNSVASFWNVLGLI